MQFSSALDYVEKYASEEALKKFCPDTDGSHVHMRHANSPSQELNGHSAHKNQDCHTDESSMSDFSEDEAKDMEL